MRVLPYALGMAVLVVAAFACGTFGETSDCSDGTCDPEAGPSMPGSGNDGGGDAPTPALGCLKANKGNNEESCICNAPEGLKQPCGLGDTGAKSRCTLGTQSCLLQADGTTKRWGACEGAKEPDPVETCFDGIDNDCDGVVDNGCPCSGDVPMCKDGKGVELTGDTLVLSKSTVADGDMFDLFYLTQQPIGTTWLGISPGGTCAGGGDIGECKSSGCPGWNVERRHVGVTVGGGGLFRSGPRVYTLSFRRGVNASEQAQCTTGPNTSQINITVQ